LLLADRLEVLDPNGGYTDVRNGWNAAIAALLSGEWRIKAAIASWCRKEATCSSSVFVFGRSRIAPVPD
jgi:hypothetical protein